MHNTQENFVFNKSPFVCQDNNRFAECSDKPACRNEQFKHVYLCHEPHFFFKSTGSIPASAGGKNVDITSLAFPGIWSTCLNWWIPLHVMVWISYMHVESIMHLRCCENNCMSQWFLQCITLAQVLKSLAWLHCHEALSEGFEASILALTCILILFWGVISYTSVFM